MADRPPRCPRLVPQGLVMGPYGIRGAVASPPTCWGVIAIDVGAGSIRFEIRPVAPPHHQSAGLSPVDSLRPARCATPAVKVDVRDGESIPAAAWLCGFAGRRRSTSDPDRRTPSPGRTRDRSGAELARFLKVPLRASESNGDLFSPRFLLVRLAAVLALGLTACEAESGSKVSIGCESPATSPCP